MGTENDIILRKFLGTSSNAFIDVRSDSYHFDHVDGGVGGWDGVELTIFDGYKLVDFTCTISGNSKDNEKEYNRGMEEFEAIKQACNAAMDELTDCYGRVELIVGSMKHVRSSTRLTIHILLTLPRASYTLKLRGFGDPMI